MARAAWYMYQHFGLPGAGLLFLLEGFGVPVPVEIPLGIVGLRMAHGLDTYWQVVVLMWLTTLTGNLIGYVVGYVGGHPLVLRFIAWFHLRNELWTKVSGWFQRHGLKIVVATRWLNWGFAQNMWLCGITRVPFARFFAVTAANDLLWSMGWAWLSRGAARYFGRRPGRFLHLSEMRFGSALLFLLLVGFAAWLGWRWWRGRRRPATDRLRDPLL